MSLTMTTERRLDARDVRALRDQLTNLLRRFPDRNLTLDLGINRISVIIGDISEADERATRWRS